MKREEAMKLVDEGIAALNEALRSGHSEILERFLDTVARFHRYSFNNAILIAAQRPDATQVAGFHAWRKFGRFVRVTERNRCSGFELPMSLMFLRRKEIHSLNSQK